MGISTMGNLVKNRIIILIIILFTSLTLTQLYLNNEPESITNAINFTMQALMTITIVLVFVVNQFIELVEKLSSVFFDT